jgi:hypothetical protein
MVDVVIFRRVALGELNWGARSRPVSEAFTSITCRPSPDKIKCDAPAVDADVAVIDKLARGEDRRNEFRAIDDRVKAPLQKADQIVAGVALQPDRFRIIFAKLLFGDIAVVALELLLGLELRAIVGELALAPLSVLSGAIFAAVDGALRAAQMFRPGGGRAYILLLRASSL